MEHFLSVREMNENDIPLIVSYWLDADPLHLQGMGVDLEKLPPRQNLMQILEQQLQLPLDEKRSYCIIWEYEGSPVGHCNTNPTAYGEAAYMHLHIWDTDKRKKGMGFSFLKKTIPLFFERLKLLNLYSEPFALNPAPNHALKKYGFELEKEYTTIPGSLNFEQPVKRWVLTKEKFDRL
jgi:RimJ/RimL family protein N-acetyltransferase